MDMLKSIFERIPRRLRKIARRHFEDLLDVYGYELTEKRLASDLRLAQLKDIHKGKRAFVIGSGPSLRVEDLDRLQSEITFACNKIYLAFDQTPWRPTYFSVIDMAVAANCSDIIKNLKLTKIFEAGVKPYFPKSKDVLWVEDIPLPDVHGSGDCKFSESIINGVYGGRTVIYTMLQIAYYMGINEVYLLGIDFNFTISPKANLTTSTGETLLRNEGELNHFHPDYRKKGELWTMPKLDEQYKAFKAAKEYFEKSGRKIFNASRSTKLDVFPIINFDDVL